MLVSVIIPTYNAAEYIVEAIESILKQTYGNIEIIIVDDGSTDSTSQVLERYVHDKKIHYFFKENGGEASARNYGLELAKGDYIAFLDADDYYHVNKLKAQMDVFEKNPDIHIVYNDVTVVDENNKELYVLKSEEVIEDPNNFLAQILNRQIIPATASIMLKRECAESNIRYSEKLTNAVDYSYILQLAEHYKFYYLEESLYYYRRHANNLTNNHKLQVESEKSLVRAIGKNKIKSIVENTDYSKDYKCKLLSKIYVKIGLYKEALVELNTMGKIDFEMYFTKGIINCFLNQYSEAIENFEICLKYQRLAEVYNNIGYCLVKLQQEKQALENFNNAILINPNYMDPKTNLEALISKESDVKFTEKLLRKTLTEYN